MLSKSRKLALFHLVAAPCLRRGGQRPAAILDRPSLPGSHPDGGTRSLRRYGTGRPGVRRFFSTRATVLPIAKTRSHSPPTRSPLPARSPSSSPPRRFSRSKSKGKLSVEDPLSKFFADLPRGKAGITLHQLLTQTAGMPDALGGRRGLDRPRHLPRKGLGRRARQRAGQRVFLLQRRLLDSGRGGRRGVGTGIRTFSAPDLLRSLWEWP